MIRLEIPADRSKRAGLHCPEMQTKVSDKPTNGGKYCKCVFSSGTHFNLTNFFLFCAKNYETS